MNVPPLSHALFDANVLIPMAICDTLMRAAVEYLYRPLWSQQILDEVKRNLISEGFATEERATRRIAKIMESQPDAMVTGYEDLHAAMTNQEKDRHVLAAAVRAGADLIVTLNLRDFPPDATAQYGIQVQSPDAFLLRLYDLEPEIVKRILHAQAYDLTRHPPGMSPVEHVLNALHRCGTPSFARAMRSEMLR
jgi:predicted nucleic acid-binding protein